MSKFLNQDAFEKIGELRKKKSISNIVKSPVSRKENAWFPDSPDFVNFPDFLTGPDVR